MMHDLIIIPAFQPPVRASTARIPAVLPSTPATALCNCDAYVKLSAPVIVCVDGLVWPPPFRHTQTIQTRHAPSDAGYRRTFFWILPSSHQAGIPSRIAREEIYRRLQTVGNISGRQITRSTDFFHRSHRMPDIPGAFCCICDF
jgi:hypothetical protein